MDLLNLKAAWEACDVRLEKTIRLNLHFIEHVQTQKVQSNLAPLLWHRLIEMFFHTVAIGLLVIFTFKNINEFRYAFPAIMLLAYYIAASVMCMRQMKVMRGMDYSSDIIFIQSSILILRTHKVNAMRLAVLFIPAFLGFPLVVSKAIDDLQLTSLQFMNLEAQYPGDWWQLQKICMIVLTPLCVAYYMLVSEKNAQRRWVSDTIRFTVGRRLAKAMEALHELEQLKKGIV